MTDYECWKNSGEEITFANSGNAELNRAAKSGGIHLYTITAATFEEAMAVHHLRQGWEPYQPTGQPGHCSRCQSIFYPEGSGECWKCEQAATKK